MCMRTWISKYFSACKRQHISWHWPFPPMPRPWQCMSNLPATSLDTLENSKAPCSCEGLEVDLCWHFGNMCSWRSSHDVLPFFGTIKNVCRTDIKYPSFKKATTLVCPSCNPDTLRCHCVGCPEYVSYHGRPAFPAASEWCFLDRGARFENWTLKFWWQSGLPVSGRTHQ